MTSMLLTTSSGRAAPFPALTPLLFLAAVALRVLELLALVHRGRLDLRAHDVLHRLDPVRDDVPLLAVPLLDEDGPASLVVLARDLDRVGEALHPDLLQPLLREVEVLEAPAHLLGRRGLSLCALHRRANSLDGEHGVPDAAVVERSATLLLPAGDFALVVDVLHDVGVQLERSAGHRDDGAL